MGRGKVGYTVSVAVFLERNAALHLCHCISADLNLMLNGCSFGRISCGNPVRLSVMFVALSSNDRGYHHCLQGLDSLN